MDNKLCQICEEGALHSRIDQILVEHLGHHGLLESRYVVCDNCHSEQTLTDDAIFNKRAMDNFTEKVKLSLKTK